jgi:hypothetical protein
VDFVTILCFVFVAEQYGKGLAIRGNGMAALIGRFIKKNVDFLICKRAFYPPD